MKKIVKFVPLISYFLSYIYLLGYWNEFGVNFAEFITLEEILISPLKNTSIYFLINLLILSMIWYVSTYRSVKRTKIKQLEYIEYIKKIRSQLIFVILIIVICGASAYFNPLLRKSLITIIFVCVITTVICLLIPKLFKFFGESKSKILIFLIFSAFLLFLNGQHEAYNAKQNQFKGKVVVEGEIYNYIGKLGNSLFLYQIKDKELVQFTPLPGKIKYR